MTHEKIYIVRYQTETVLSNGMTLKNPEVYVGTYNNYMDAWRASVRVNEMYFQEDRLEVTITETKRLYLWQPHTTTFHTNTKQ